MDQQDKEQLHPEIDDDEDEDFLAEDLDDVPSDNFSSSEDEEQDGPHSRDWATPDPKLLAAVDDPGALPLVEEELPDDSSSSGEETEVDELSDDEATESAGEVVQGQDQQDQSHAVSFGRLPAQSLVDSQLHHAGIHIYNPSQADAVQEAIQAVAAAVASGLPLEARAPHQVQTTAVSVQGSMWQLPRLEGELDPAVVDSAHNQSNTAGTAQVTYNTRARCNLKDVAIEELEKALQEDWFEDSGFLQDDEEYEKFLRVLRGEEVPSFLQSDDDDEEFQVPADGDRPADYDEEDLELEELESEDELATDEEETGEDRAKRKRARRLLPERRAKTVAAAVLRRAAAAANNQGQAPQMTTAQIKTLYWQIHIHTQLLLQLHAITSKDTHENAQDLATKTLTRLEELKAARHTSTALAMALGKPCIPPLLLGMSEQQQQQQQQQQGAVAPSGSLFGNSEDSNAGVTPAWSPPVIENVQGVLDVGPLRKLDDYKTVLALIPNMEVSATQELLDLAAEDSITRKKKRRYNYIHPYKKCWDTIAIPVLEICMPGMMNPNLHYVTAPQVPTQYWSPGEDELLATGIAKYGTDWNAIATNLLPYKTPHQIFVRQKNMAQRKKTHVVVAVRSIVKGPLTQAEINRITDGIKALMPFLPAHRQNMLMLPPAQPDSDISDLTAAYQELSRQSEFIEQAWHEMPPDITGFWEAVCQEYLPHRKPDQLYKEWNEYVRLQCEVYQARLQQHLNHLTGIYPSNPPETGANQQETGNHTQGIDTAVPIGNGTQPGATATTLTATATPAEIQATTSMPACNLASDQNGSIEMEVLRTLQEHLRETQGSGSEATQQQDAYLASKLAEIAASLGKQAHAEARQEPAVTTQLPAALLGESAASLPEAPADITAMLSSHLNQLLSFGSYRSTVGHLQRVRALLRKQGKDAYSINYVRPDGTIVRTRKPSANTQKRAGRGASGLERQAAEGQTQADETYEDEDASRPAGVTPRRSAVDEDSNSQQPDANLLLDYLNKALDPEALAAAGIDLATTSAKKQKERKKRGQDTSASDAPVSKDTIKTFLSSAAKVLPLLCGLTAAQEQATINDAGGNTGTANISAAPGNLGQQSAVLSPSKRRAAQLSPNKGKAPLGANVPLQTQTQKEAAIANDKTKPVKSPMRPPGKRQQAQENVAGHQQTIDQEVGPTMQNRNNKQLQPPRGPEKPLPPGFRTGRPARNRAKQAEAQEEEEGLPDHGQMQGHAGKRTKHTKPSGNERQPSNGSTEPSEQPQLMVNLHAPIPTYGVPLPIMPFDLTTQHMFFPIPMLDMTNGGMSNFAAANLGYNNLSNFPMTLTTLPLGTNSMHGYDFAMQHAVQHTPPHVMQHAVQLAPPQLMQQTLQHMQPQVVMQPVQPTQPQMMPDEGPGVFGFPTQSQLDILCDAATAAKAAQDVIDAAARHSPIDADQFDSDDGGGGGGGKKRARKRSVAAESHTAVAPPSKKQRKKQPTTASKPPIPTPRGRGGKPAANVAAADAISALLQGTNSKQGSGRGKQNPQPSFRSMLDDSIDLMNFNGSGLHSIADAAELASQEAAEDERHAPRRLNSRENTRRMEDKAVKPPTDFSGIGRLGSSFSNRDSSRQLGTQPATLHAPSNTRAAGLLQQPPSAGQLQTDTTGNNSMWDYLRVGMAEGNTIPAPATMFNTNMNLANHGLTGLGLSRSHFPPMSQLHQPTDFAFGLANRDVSEQAENKGSRSAKSIASPTKRPRKSPAKYQRH